MREISCVQVSLVVIGSWALHRALYRMWTSRKLVAALRRIGIRIERYVEEADHHLFPTLFAPADFMRGVRVVLVVDRVVVMRRTLDDRTFRQLQRLRQGIAKLPTEAVVRHLQQSLRLAVGKYQAKLEILAAKMHVRE